MRKSLVILVVLLLLMPLLFVGRIYQVVRLAGLDELPPISTAGDGGSGLPRASRPLTILVVGVDADELLEGRGAVRSDTIVIGSVDPLRREARFLSVPRDTYVEIPGYGMDKINHAFAYGNAAKGKTGIELTKQTLKGFLGLDKIDHYVIVDMQSVPRLVDAIGGVELDVDITHPQLERGVQLLNGQQALDYARWRMDAMGDIGRVRRQQQLLMAVIKKATQMDFGMLALMELTRFGLAEVRTDIPFMDAVYLATRLKDMHPESVEFHMLPGWFLDIDGISYWGPDMEALAPIIEEVFGTSKVSGLPDQPALSLVGSED